MIQYNPLLCLDFYKTAHAQQYPVGLTKMVSYYTPRMSRLDDTEKVTMLSVQYQRMAVVLFRHQTIHF